DLVLMDGAATGEEGLGDGDADGDADDAHEIEEAAGVADLFVVEGAVGGGAKGNEDKAEAEAGDEDGEVEGGGGDVEGNVADVEGGEAEGEEAEGEQVARIYFV